MSDQRYRYAIEIYQSNGQCAGQIPASVDWEPARQWTWMTGIRKGLLRLTDGIDTSAIRPLWGETGEPYVDGFRVTIMSERSDGISEDFSTAYFMSAVTAATARLREKGRLNKDEGVRFLALATFNEDHAKAGPTRRLKSRELPPEVTIVPSTLADFVGASTLVNAPAGETSSNDIPIVIPRRVLDETRDLTRQAGANETGGILIGHLRQDPGLPELFVEITAQIPAAHAPARVDRLTFTPETWTAAQAALDFRRGQEVFQGFWHSHPVYDWCRKCPEEKRLACPLAQGFMSADDCQLHRTVFPRAYTCALVVSHVVENQSIVHSLFGWRRGLIESRSFYVMDGAPQSEREAAAKLKRENP